MDKVALIIAVILLLGNSCSCSPDISHPDSRIVGGDDSSVLSLRYQVSIHRRNGVKSAYAHTCGGSLLDGSTVLTAAHCVYNRHEENFMVVAGTDLHSGMDGGVVSRVTKLLPHELYNATITDNDIALIFVSPPFPMNTNRRIGTIEVAKELPSVGTLATVSGWGFTKEDGLPSARLQQVQVPVVDSKDCQAAYDWRPITDAMLCAAAPGGGKEACNGDAGGALVVNNQVVGVVSWAEGCAREAYPGVYASASHFHSWIAEQRAAYAKMETVQRTVAQN
ncbi:trypsin eta [Drosophila grimshawi]|uniref:trypsin n=1 Tax=Drosophila grimshawi TaxID=7222 RepID=B4JVV4_DROGR|nr:trypsin eta [Drosophila grimshawi]EDV98092.1 GH22867 [Drosophila grimshawi]